jgi:cell division inhibitor SepF
VSVWRDIKARLGFGDDDEYDEYDEYDEADDDVDGLDTPAYRSPYDDEPTSIKRVHREPDLDRARDAGRAPVAPGPGMQAVPQVKMQIVEPRTYAEAQGIADKFKLGVPVIMNLTMTDADLARRLLDFASGLTYGLNGGLQKVSDKVFMLTPANVDVNAAQRAAMRDKGLFGIDG